MLYYGVERKVLAILGEDKMKHRVLLAIVVMLAATGIVQAQDAGLHGVIDMTYQSKYIWRGFDLFGDKSGFQPSIDLDLYGSGFGVSAMGHRANSSGYELGERWDYTLYYQGHAFGDAKYAMNYRLGWVYYNFPEYDAPDYDLQELQAVMSFPNILPVKGLVPTYVLVKLYPSSENSVVEGLVAGGTASGFAHIFMLDYAVPMPGILPSQPEQVLRLHSEVIYNDGVHPGGGNADQDWSNAVFGVDTDFNVGKCMTFTPGLYHQITMDDSINDDKDETWMTFSLKYKF